MVPGADSAAFERSQSRAVAGECVVPNRPIAQRVEALPTLHSVIDHYGAHLGLGLSEQEKLDLVEYLKSI
jgi:hypothetical protein